MRLYQRECGGVDSSIFSNWAKKLVAETANLLEAGQNMPFLFDGYSCHIQHCVLQLLRENRLYVIVIPAHTSHVLQLLEVPVYGLFKSYIQSEVHARYVKNA